MVFTSQNQGKHVFNTSIFVHVATLTKIFGRLVLKSWLKVCLLQLYIDLYRVVGVHVVAFTGFLIGLFKK